ncbi:PIG-L family deacetylase [Cetobacterium somerae]|uniref:PIG-L family deacetylase n=1 Tax=Cetobacterium somerae TaxID=188913 RepID=UPI00211EA457|nr:PIG-L family deacetylase [Cetobacterium somerae]MCQ9626453.1 PIG-L family deacetylase [Cetobacterium somerae]
MIKKIKYYIKSKIKRKYIYLKNYKYSNPKILYKNVDKLLIVAHPDDEVVFFFNELLKEKEWLVICVTNGDNQIRLNEFIQSMKNLKCSYQIWGFEDGWLTVWNEKKVKKKIKKIIEERNWKKVLTHNENGEYGHFQHKQLNKIVKELYEGYDIGVPLKKEKLLKEKNMLEKNIQIKKLEHMKKYYKSQEHIIDNLQIYFKYEKIEKLGSENVKRN